MTIIAGIAEQDDGVIVTRRNVGDLHFESSKKDIEASGKGMLNVQNSTLSENNHANLVRDVYRGIRGIPSNVVGLPNKPNSTSMRISHRGYENISENEGKSSDQCAKSQNEEKQGVHDEGAEKRDFREEKDERGMRRYW